MSCDPFPCEKCGALSCDFTHNGLCAPCWNAMTRPERRAWEREAAKRLKTLLRDDALPSRPT